MKRSASFDVDRDFDVFCDVTKYTTLPDGRRLIRGVASGTVEDADGERVSARAIAEMAAQGTRGIKVVAGSHAQDWTNEIGDAVELRHDPETDELIADAILPAEGEDPLADKACRRMDAGEKLGWSIGGKLRSAYQELVEAAGGGVRKRKVLDSILLKHLCLTEKPAYRTSVVGGVAKCAKDVVFDDSIELYDVDPADEMRDAAAIVAKATQTVDEEEPAAQAPQADPAASAPAEAPAGAPAADGEAPPDDPNAAPPAGTTDTSADPNAAPSDAQAAQGLPLANRHLSCPNCGEEFAAELPATGPLNADGSSEPETNPGGDTAKTKETPMDVKAELAELRATLERVEKAASEGTEQVTKTETETAPSDLERLIAASHKTNSDAIADVGKGVTEGFDLVAKTVQKLAAQIAEMPQGRRSHSSIALAKPGTDGGVEVAKTATDTEDVQKTAEQIAESGDLTGALRHLNAARGIR